MDEKTKLTVYKIKLLAEQNPEFYQEMQKLFGKTASASDVNMNSNISSDIAAIRSALEIRANASITYSFVKNQRVRCQLIIDNLRMENVVLSLQRMEKDVLSLQGLDARRFSEFCLNAFYQIENILNYFYYTAFPEIDTLLKVIEFFTKEEKDGFKFKSTGNNDVSSIDVHYKVNAFFNAYLPKEKSLKWSIGTLRQVRNKCNHRCDIIGQEKDGTNLDNFFKEKTFNDVRIDLIKFVNAIEDKLKNPDKLEKEESEIKSKLPGACFVLLSGESVQLPDKLFDKIKYLDNGAKIILTVIGKRIIDVNEP